MTSTSLEQAAHIAHVHWGVSGSGQLLGGENINVGFTDAVLKITREPQADPSLEQRVAEHLHAAGMLVPVAMAATDGATLVPVQFDGQPAVARLLPRLDGTPWQALDDPARAYQAVGTALARLHLALADATIEGACRTHAWDVVEAQQHRHLASLVSCPALRALVEDAFLQHAACDLDDCPGGLLHGDFNDENVLIQDDAVTGILDLGDTLEGPWVADLAIAAAYAFMHEQATAEAVGTLVGAYDAVRPLDADEQQALVPLLRARLATSVVLTAERAAMPNDAPTLQSAEAAIKRASAMPPRALEQILCAGCRVHRSGGVNTVRLAARRAAVLPGVLSLSYAEPLHIVRGRGQYLISSDGRAYLDMVNNVCHVGHCNDHVVRATAKQSARLNTNTRYLHEGVLNWADRLVATMPDALDTVLFVNSGSEANELALRLARAATGATDVAVIDGAYHGNTSACIDMSPYKFNGAGGRGCPDWVHVVPAPDVYRGEHRGDDAGAAYALEAACVLGEAAAKGRAVAAFFAESLLSCGGQVPLPPGYLPATIEHVRKAGALYVADEVQVGFGRVGDAMWGFQLHDVVPDIVVLGKPIGNGHPIGAVVTTRAIAEAFTATGMEFFSTFGGNPVSAAVGNAVLDVIEQEGLMKRAARLGARMRAGLEQLRDRVPSIGDVRGAGLFLGVEFVHDHETLEPAADIASAVVNAMRERGVLLSTDGPLQNVIKIKPPMVLTEGDVDMVLRLLGDVCSAHA